MSVLGKAICTFFEGHTRVLFVSYLSKKGAFILSMCPPELNQELSVVFHLGDKPPLPPIKGRVVDMCIDPYAAIRNGFSIEFVDLEMDAYRALNRAISSLDGVPDRPPTRVPTFYPERRKEARVALHHRAVVEYGTWVLRGALKNLSVSGALIGLDWPGACSSLKAGVTLSVSFESGAPSKALKFTAEVVRLVSGKGTCEIGVRFVDVGSDDRMLLDSFLLKRLVRQISDPAGSEGTGQEDSEAGAPAAPGNRRGSLTDK